MAGSGDTAELETFFNRATKHVASTLAGGLDNAALLSLYARYKQATEGACGIERPSGWFDAKGKQKWSVETRSIRSKSFTLKLFW